jgi:hypothetical protein
VEFGEFGIEKKQNLQKKPVPEFIDPVFTKTSPKRSFSLNRKRAFWLVFAKTGSIISGTECQFKIFTKFVDIQFIMENLKSDINIQKERHF